MASQKRAFLTLFLVVATELIGFGLIIPILPQLAAQFESSGLLLGFLMASYSIAQFISAPILGKLSDRYGRKPVLMFSKLGTVLAYIILAFAQSYSLFLVSRIIDGFTGGNIAVARAYVSDITTKKDRPKGMALIGISFGVGFILGPALGGLLYGLESGHMIPALVAGSLSFLAFLFTVFLLEEPTRKKEMGSPVKFLQALPQVAKSPAVLIICGVQMMYLILFSGFETTFSIFTHRLFQFSIQDNSLLFFYIGFLALIFQGYLSRKASSKIKSVTLFGLVVLSASYILLGINNTTTGLYIVLIFMSMGISIVNTYLPSLLTLNSDERSTGLVMGVYDSLGSLGRIIGPLVVYTTLFTALPLLYILSGCILAVCTVLFFISTLQRFGLIQGS